MRQKSRRCKVEKLFVLGAGASFSATRPNASYKLEPPPAKQTPLDKHFTTVLNELHVKRPPWVAESCKLIKRAWSDESRFTNFGLEAAILTQGAHMEFFEAIHRKRRNTSLTYPEYLNHMAHLITYSLRRGREGKENTYSKFARKYFPRVKTGNRIITFNYDDVLDKILSRRFHLNKLYFSRMLSDRGKLVLPGGSDFPVLIKLHGSVNWNCLSEDFIRVVEKKKDEQEERYIPEVWFNSKGTPSPDDDVSPCIIPPIVTKPITSISLFRFLWTRAYEYLHEAEEIIVCGYSLPPTDALAASLFSNFRNDRLRRVIVVDPDPSIMAKWRRLLSLKNVSAAEWLYFADFSEFVDSAHR